jgi:hypothetical protein
MTQYFLSIRSFFAAILLLAGLLPLAGCGSSDTPLTKHEFVKRADAICTRTEKGIQAGFGRFVQENKVPTSGPGVKAKAAEFVDTTYAPLYHRQIDEIESLAAPEGDQQEVTAILGAMKGRISAGEERPLALIRGTLQEDASKLASAYGLTSCTT